MPELPDVAGFSHYIERTALHQTIAKTSVTDDRVLEGVSPRKLAGRLKSRSFGTTRRHGKFLFVRVGKKGWLVLHFGMTGELAYFKNGDQPDHTCLLLSFDNGYHLAYQSRRKLGQVSFTEDRDAFIEDHDLGPDALDDDLDLDAFLNRLSGRKGAIKPALMNQSIIAGIGNVYADEILFQAGIHPETTVDELDEATLKNLHRVMRRVLRVAADHDAVVEDLPRGYLLKHRGEDENCPKCGGTIQSKTVSGRTTYFCPACQPPNA